jgi:acyl-CoA synthetase (AMP-forming)/AMP-acid ligase II
MNIGEFLTLNARNYPEKNAVVFSDKRLSYLELNERANALANGLTDIGVVRGDKVATLLRNSTEYIEIYFALAKIGAVGVPLNITFSTRNIHTVIEMSDCSAVICHKEFQKKHNLLDSKVIIKPEKFVCIGRRTASGCNDYEKLVNSHFTTEPEVRVKDENDFVIVFTSGSTRQPKPVILTHRSMILRCVFSAIEYAITFDDINLISTPLYHNMAQWFVMLNLLVGGSVVLMRKFDAEEWFSLIQKERITYAVVVPAQLSILLSLPRVNEYNLSSLKTLISSSAALPPQIKEKILKLFKGRFHNSYGCTETGLLTNLRPYGKFYSVGKPYFFTEVRIVDSNWNDVSEGEVGEIVGKGPACMKGYYKINEEAINSYTDGFIRTGDLGKFDKENNLFVVSRKKDVIISGGVNIYSEDIEEVLNSHSKVKECAVIGVNDRKWGEAATAIIQLKNGEHMSKEQMFQFCEENLAGYQKPKSIHFVKDLPRDELGKILKGELRKRFGKS